MGFEVEWNTLFLCFDNSGGVFHTATTTVITGSFFFVVVVFILLFVYCSLQLKFCNALGK